MRLLFQILSCSSLRWYYLLFFDLLWKRWNFHFRWSWRELFFNFFFRGWFLLYDRVLLLLSGRGHFVPIFISLVWWHMTTQLSFFFFWRDRLGDLYGFFNWTFDWCFNNICWWLSWCICLSILGCQLLNKFVYYYVPCICIGLPLHFVCNMFAFSFRHTSY